MRPICSWSKFVYRQAFSESVMPKKILTAILAFVIGMLAVLAVIKIASSGYTFGQYLAQLKTQP
jgi:hypothetical protein